MAIAGIGVDIVEIKRIAHMREKYGDRFLSKIFTAAEIAICLDSERPDERFAGRFAAKEAVMKALKLGIYLGVHFKDIEIIGGGSVKPEVKLHSNADKAAINAGVTGISVSLSHERKFAVAMAIAEK